MPAPVQISRRESAFSPDQPMSPLLHPALSTSLSKSFGLNSPFSLAAMSSSLKDMSSSPGFSSMGMSLGRSFEERPKIEAQFFKNFTCCGLDLHDLHGLLEHFEECHVAYDDDEDEDASLDGQGDDMDAEIESEGTISGPPSPRLMGQVPRFEIKKSGLSSSSAFDTPDSPASPALHLDGGMELDMEMGDDDDQHHQHQQHSASSSSAGSRSQNGTTSSISAFDPLHGSASKKRSSPPAASFPPNATSAGVQLPPIGGSRSRSASAQTSDNPTDNEREEAEALSYLNPAAVNSPMGVTNNAQLSPSFLFNSSPNKPVSSNNQAQDPSQASTSSGAAPGLHEFEFDDGIEAVQETDSEDDADAHDVADDENSFAFSSQTYDQGGRPNRGLASAGQALPSLPTQLPLINPHDPATINALANSTLKDPHQTAAAIAALGPNSLAALPTALHPLGQGVQISPSGRPYTPPSEKPFKCTVPGCDKSYKQQNGLKYHRLHGHCGSSLAGASGGVPSYAAPSVATTTTAAAVSAAADKEASTATSGGERSEGKPYICHVASCGKRYKNMNGLRYHYQHSGAHGALGLQMLAQGCHPPPQYPAGSSHSQQHINSIMHNSVNINNGGGGSGSKRGFATGSGLQLGGVGGGGHHQLQQSFTATSSAASSRASSPAPAYRGGGGGGVDASGLSAALSRY
ncbi:hypothetical protein JCM10908_001473 [Rhodotorula pacifica]|uniref:zinc-coordinating transcription factor SFP1 n=1 Tax=Rhodotorula pacifica TaxID=1495444 RepID=UPI0031767AA6